MARTKHHSRHQSLSRATFQDDRPSNGHPLLPCQILNGYRQASIRHKMRRYLSLLNQSRKTRPFRKTFHLTSQKNPLRH